MAEAIPQSAAGPHFDDNVGVVLYALARGLAVLGGLVLVAISLVAVVSILGRWLFSAPLPGDYELAQLAAAVSVATFLPYCQMRGGHVLVDFFTARSSPRVKGWLDFVGSLVLAAVAAVLAWRTTLGMVELRATGEMTMILSIPTWLAYIPMVPSFALLALAALYSAWRNLRQALR